MAYADGSSTLNAGKKIVKFNITTITDAATIASSEISVYPNPASDMVVISSDEEISYQLIGMNGLVVYAGTTSASNVINTSSIPSGVYMLKLSSPDVQKVEKLVIHH